MTRKVRWRSLSAITKVICLHTLFVLCSLQSFAAGSVSKVLLRPEVSPKHRDELTKKLRAITGWNDLGIDRSGSLIPGNDVRSGGSRTARDLLASAVAGDKLVVIEDASNRQDIAFCSVVEGRWTSAPAGQPRAYAILIDFDDFSHVMGDRAALEAFNVGWAVLHEIDHVVHDSIDPSREGEAGECEAVVNQMRRECGLAERTDYFFSYVPGISNNEFMTRFVRMAFDERSHTSNKRKRHWLVWDAALVGGLNQPGQLASRR